MTAGESDHSRVYYEILDAWEWLTAPLFWHSDLRIEVVVTNSALYGKPIHQGEQLRSSGLSIECRHVFCIGFRIHDSSPLRVRPQCNKELAIYTSQGQRRLRAAAGTIRLARGWLNTVVCIAR
jgi:hypothetical protein